MKVLRHTDPGFTKSLAALKRHAEPTDEVRTTVREIIAAIRKRGDAALLELTAKFGGPLMKAGQLLITEKPSVDAATKRAVATAHRNVSAFAKKSLRKSWTGRNAQGVKLINLREGETLQDIARVPHVEEELPDEASDPPTGDPPTEPEA